MTKRWISDDDAGITLSSFYGWDLKPDPEVVKRREEQVAKIKAEMGDKFLLAKRIEKVEE